MSTQIDFETRLAVINAMIGAIEQVERSISKLRQKLVSDLGEIENYARIVKDTPPCFQAHRNVERATQQAWNAAYDETESLLRERDKLERQLIAGRPT